MIILLLPQEYQTLQARPSASLTAADRQRLVNLQEQLESAQAALQRSQEAAERAQQEAAAAQRRAETMVAVMVSLCSAANILASCCTAVEHCQLLVESWGRHLYVCSLYGGWSHTLAAQSGQQSVQGSHNT